MERWIVGGMVVDDLGAPARQADLHIAEDEIIEVRSGAPFELGSEAEVIDATGLVVAPGFIDLHSHSDIALLADPIVECKLNQGITLEVIGQDGLSVAPAHRRRGTRLAASSQRPHRELRRSVGLALVRRLPLALSAHGRQRRRTRGPWNHPDERLGDGEPDARRCRTGPDAGIAPRRAAGGRVRIVRGAGVHAGSYAAFEELAALTKIVAQAGKLLVVHIRYEGDRIAEGLAEMFRLAEETGVALHVSHFKVMGQRNAGRGAEIARLIEERRADGMDVTVDQYP